MADMSWLRVSYLNFKMVNVLYQLSLNIIPTNVIFPIMYELSVELFTYRTSQISNIMFRLTLIRLNSKIGSLVYGHSNWISYLCLDSQIGAGMF